MKTYKVSFFKEEKNSTTELIFIMEDAGDTEAQSALGIMHYRGIEV